MAIPLSFGFDPVQCFIALDMAGIGLTSIADEDDVSLLSVVALVAEPVHNFIIPWLV
jgi:hypothetical protein